MSGWSRDTFSYPPPRISSVDLLNRANPVPSPVRSSGGDLILIRGRRLLQNSVLSVTIGGLLVEPLTDLLPPDPAGRSLLFAAPRGFGVVDVVVTVGLESVYSTLSYAPATILALQWFNGQRADPTRLFGITGDGLSACALCYDATGVLPLGCDPSTSGSCDDSACAVSSECACARISNVINPATCALPTSSRAALPTNLSLSGRGLATDATSDAQASPAFAVTVGGEQSVVTYIEMNDTAIRFVTTGLEGDLTVSIANVTTSEVFSYSDLTSTQPKIGALSPATDLDTSGGSVVTVPCTNLRTTGSVTLTTALNATNGGACVFECPIVWSTCLRSILNDCLNGTLAHELYDGATLTIDGTTFTNDDSAANFGVANALILSSSRGDLQHRLVYDSASNAWVEHRIMPCYITNWMQQVPVSSNSEEGIVKVSMPAWQGNTGPLLVSLVTEDVQAQQGKTVNYAVPVLDGVSPSAGVPTSGETITLVGSGFGPAVSLSDYWNSLIDNSTAGLIPAYIRRTAQPTVRSGVKVSYSQTSQELPGSALSPLCSVVTWSPSSITCILSAGVSGAAYTLVVQQASGLLQSPYLLSIGTAELTYAPPVIRSVAPAVQATAGGYTTILGTDFPPDLRLSSVWTGFVIISPVEGLLDGSSQSAIVQ